MSYTLLLYAGTIHQAQSLPDQSSLHLTISANQRNTWADFFALALPAAIDLAFDEDISLRESLPLKFTSYMVRHPWLYSEHLNVLNILWHQT